MRNNVKFGLAVAWFALFTSTARAENVSTPPLPTQALTLSPGSRFTCTCQAGQVVAFDMPVDPSEISSAKRLDNDPTKLGLVDEVLMACVAFGKESGQIARVYTWQRFHHGTNQGFTLVVINQTYTVTAK